MMKSAVLRAGGRAAFGVISFGILAGPGLADGSAIYRANNQVGIGLIGTNIDYLEKDQAGKPLDGENGTVLGGRLYVSTMQDIGTDNLYMSAELGIQGPRTQYTGSYIGGNYGDLKQENTAAIYNQDIRIGKGFGVADIFMLTPYVGIGAREWQRGITGIGGYNELYSHGYGGAGLMVQVAAGPRVVFGAHGMIAQTFGPSMNASLSTNGAAIIPQQYWLGSSRLWMAGADMDYAINRNMHVNAGVEYSQFDYGKSGVSSIDSSYEPASSTTQWAAKMGFGYSF